MILQKGDLVKWRGDDPSIGVVMEDQKQDWPRVLVYWFDDGESSRERIDWVTLLRKEKVNESV